MRLDIYSSSTPGVVVEKAILWNSWLRFNFWASYELRITRNEAILNVDGRFLDRQGFNTLLPTRRSAKLALLPQANSPLTMLINTLTIIDGSTNATVLDRVF